MLKIENIAFYLILVLVVLINVLLPSSNILTWDVFGYYLYLPLTFIYTDLGLENIDVVYQIVEKYKNTATLYQVIKAETGAHVLKYSAGWSLFYLPFFLIGHLFALLFSYPLDGFSLPYQQAVFAGGIFYSLLGIVVLKRVLQSFFSQRVSLTVLLFTVFGTNFIVHMLMHGQNAMSHNVLFTCYALLLYYTIAWHKTFQTKYAIILALLCGLTILTRPSEIVCLLIPILWGVYDKETLLNKVSTLKERVLQLLLFSIIIVAIGCIQFFYWKMQTGEFLYYSYVGNAGEGFNFFHPYILEALFSFRKGWLIYTPVMFGALVGFIYMFRQNKSIFFAVFFYFICSLYVTSSWSCWWYAQSFSQRSLIPTYALLSIPFGYFIQAIFDFKKLLKITVVALLVFLFGLNIFQTIQFHRGVLSTDRMTFEYYKAIFGKWNVTEGDKKLLLVDRSFDGIELIRDITEYNSRSLPVNIESNCKSEENAFCFKLDKETLYTPALIFKYKELTKQDHAWVKVTSNVYSNNWKEVAFSFVFHFSYKGYSYKYKDMKMEVNQFKDSTWNSTSFYYLTPEVRTVEDTLKMYFWNQGEGEFFVKDFEVEVLERKW